MSSITRQNNIADDLSNAYSDGLRDGAPKWIKTTDRLPEPWVTVLLWDGDEMVSGYAVDDGDLIEHRWGLVFLPEPPGEEVEGMNYYAFKNSQETEVLDFGVKNSIRKNSDNCEQGKPYELLRGGL